jgi:hypothetical protein
VLDFNARSPLRGKARLARAARCEGTCRLLKGLRATGHADREAVPAVSGGEIETRSQATKGRPPGLAARSRAVGPIPVLTGRPVAADNVCRPAELQNRYCIRALTQYHGKSRRRGRSRLAPPHDESTGERDGRRGCLFVFCAATLSGNRSHLDGRVGVSCLSRRRLMVRSATEGCGAAGST